MVSTLLTPTSFCFLVWRRPETGDRCKMGNGSRVTAACLSPPFRISQTAYCYTYQKVNAEGGTAIPPKGQTNRRAWNALSDAEETLVSVQEYPDCRSSFRSGPAYPIFARLSIKIKGNGSPKRVETVGVYPFGSHAG